MSSSDSDSDYERDNVKDSDMFYEFKASLRQFEEKIARKNEIADALIAEIQSDNASLSNILRLTFEFMNEPKCNLSKIALHLASYYDDTIFPSANYKLMACMNKTDNYVDEMFGSYLIGYGTETFVLGELVRKCEKEVRCTLDDEKYGYEFVAMVTRDLTKECEADFASLKKEPTPFEIIKCLARTTRMFIACRRFLNDVIKCETPITRDRMNEYMDNHMCLCFGLMLATLKPLLDEIKPPKMSVDFKKKFERVFPAGNPDRQYHTTAKHIVTYMNNREYWGPNETKYFVTRIFSKR